MADTAKVKRNIARMIEQGADESEIDAYVASEGTTAEELRRPSVAMDVAKAFPAGVARGVAGTVGGPRAESDLVRSGIDFLAGDSLAGGSKAAIGTVADVVRQAVNPLARVGQYLPTAERATAAIESVTGPLYKPKTTLGNYAERIGEFLPNAVGGPASIPGRAAMVAAPAIASESAGQFFEGSRIEPYARAAGAVAGGAGTAVGLNAINNARSTVPGMSSRASKVLERNTLPDTEANLSKLGPEAMLFEGSEPMFGYANAIANRPGVGSEALRGALNERQAAANTRLQGDINAAAGPAHVPSLVEATLKQQRDLVAKDYAGAVRGGQRIDVRPTLKEIGREIEAEAGIPKKTLNEIKSYLFKEMTVKGEDGKAIKKTVLKTSPEEILNVRQALDDLIQNTTQPNAMRLAVKYREKIDGLIAKSAPEIKAVDARFSELAKQSEALSRGGQVLNAGKEAIRPFELLQEVNAMTPAQRDMLVKGARAEIDRIIGTKTNDVTALKQLIQSEGDWNQLKLQQLFGREKAERIISAIGREWQFQTNYRNVMENSRTAQRQMGARVLDAETGDGNQSLQGMTFLGAAASAGKKAKDVAVGALTKRQAARADEELGRALSLRGDARDRLLKQIRDAQSKRGKGQLDISADLVRALLAARASQFAGQ